MKRAGKRNRKLRSQIVWDHFKKEARNAKKQEKRQLKRQKRDARKRAAKPLPEPRPTEFSPLKIHEDAMAGD